MEVRRTTRRWRPGRQTLTRIDPGRMERRDVPAGGDAVNNEAQETHDPVYDWFDLRRPPAPVAARRRGD